MINTIDCNYVKIWKINWRENVLKITELKEVIKLIDKSSISEFSYEKDGAKIKLKKESMNNGAYQVIPHPFNYESVSPVEQETTTTTKAEAIELKETKTLKEDSSIEYDYEIVSPMVGTLYNRPTPESETYVEVGSKVTKKSIVCIVEAMKLFNEIEAEVAGEIVEVLVKNGELVEYGQPLFRIKTK